MARLILGAVSALLLLPSAFAESLPFFHRDGNTWAATHIIVVDAKGNVLEAWKGDLKAGDRVPVDDLVIPRGSKISYRPFAKQEGDPESATGDRVVFFLIRGGLGNVWYPASFPPQMALSVAYLENKRAFAFEQWGNPGQGVLSPLREDEAGLKKRVQKVVQLQDQLRDARNIPDPGRRAKAAAELYDGSGSAWVGPNEVFDILGGCGAAGVAAARELINQTKDSRHYSQLVRAMWRADEALARAELLKLVDAEVTYWRKAWPELTPKGVTGEQQTRVFRVQACLDGLAWVGVPREQQGPVVELRDIWKANVYLYNFGRGMSGPGAYQGPSPVVEAAEKVLRSNAP